MGNKKVNNFDIFLEGVRINDLGSIPGKEPGEKNYISDVTNRAKTRLGIENRPEGDMMSLSRAGGDLAQSAQKSQMLSRGHEKELEDLATSVIKKQFGPILDYYKIGLDIKFSTGPEIREFIDTGYSKNANRRNTAPNENEKPTVKARGVDFSMLIHEAVKGIWRVLSMRSVPIDPEIAHAIESQFSLSDEPEDWRYGPEIAADLRDFVNENPKVTKYPNVREEIWLYMTDERKIPTAEFLDLMKGILSKTEKARVLIDDIIDEILIKLERREKYLKDLAEYEFKMKEYERQMSEYSKKMSAQGKAARQETKPAVSSDPYSEMTQKELNHELSKALDVRDFAKVKEISKYLK
jgi:hypothetical protein